jgi:hypothetical protein
VTTYFRLGAIALLAPLISCASTTSRGVVISTTDAAASALPEVTEASAGPSATSTYPIPASSGVAKRGGCGSDPIAVVKTFVAATQAGDQSTYLRCEDPGLKLSADMLQGLASGIYLLDAAAPTDQVNPPPAPNEVVVRVPAPDQPGDTISDGTLVVHRPPHASGVIVRTAQDSDGSYYIADVVFYASS